MSTQPRDVTVTRALLKRLAEELNELESALVIGSDANVLDELVDVRYYLDKLAAHHRISADCVSQYSAAKTALRAGGTRCKPLELRLAAELVTSSQLEYDWTRNES